MCLDWELEDFASTNHSVITGQLLNHSQIKELSYFLQHFLSKEVERTIFICYKANQGVILLCLRFYKVSCTGKACWRGASKTICAIVSAITCCYTSTWEKFWSRVARFAGSIYWAVTSTICDWGSAPCLRFNEFSFTGKACRGGTSKTICSIVSAITDSSIWRRKSICANSTVSFKIESVVWARGAEDIYWSTSSADSVILVKVGV